MVGRHVSGVSQSWASNVGVVSGSSHIGVVGGHGGESGVAHTHIGLAHAGVGSVDGLGVGGDLSQVSGGPQDVLVLASDGSGLQASVADGVSGGNGEGGLAHCDQRANNDELCAKNIWGLGLILWVIPFRGTQELTRNMMVGLFLRIC